MRKKGYNWALDKIGTKVGGEAGDTIKSWKSPPAQKPVQGLPQGRGGNSIRRRKGLGTRGR